MLNNKISISGDLGSGKTTVSLIIAEKLNFNRYSTGDVQRSLAAEKNMTTLEFNKLSETKDYIDKLIDGKTAEMANSEESIIFDSRMAWYFVPNSFGVRLVVSDVIGAERIMGAERGQIEAYSKLEEALQKVNERKNSEKSRFINKYGVNLLEFSNYDLVIDTSYVAPEDVASLIIEKYELWIKEESYNKIWINPRSLYPTLPIKEMDLKKIESLREELVNEENPLEMIRFEENNYIFHGHHMVGAALLNNTNFLSTRLVQEDSLGNGETLESYIKNSCTLSVINDWEERFDFTFNNYPDFVK